MTGLQRTVATALAVFVTVAAVTLTVMWRLDSLDRRITTVEKRVAVVEQVDEHLLGALERLVRILEGEPT